MPAEAGAAGAAGSDRPVGAPVPMNGEIDAGDKNVVVIGGGETGSDCVEAALAQGAREVHQFEILDESDSPRDLTHRRPSDVQQRYCVATREFQGDDQVSKVIAAEVRWMRTATGPRMVEVPGSRFNLDVDLVLLAMGFEAEMDVSLAEQLGLKPGGEGRVEVRDQATSAPGVFVAGDAASGASLVVSAIHSGRKAAEKIDEYLRQ